MALTPVRPMPCYYEASMFQEVAYASAYDLLHGTNDYRAMYLCTYQCFVYA